MREIIRIVFIIITCVLMLCSYAVGAEVEGTYLTEGVNIDGETRYKGTTIIKKNGNTYNVTWKVGTTYKGTGIVSSNVLSVVFLNEKDRYFGVASYDIKESGKRLEGKWCFFNHHLIGTETLIRK